MTNDDAVDADDEIEAHEVWVLPDDSGNGAEHFFWIYEDPPAP